MITLTGKKGKSKMATPTEENVNAEDIPTELQGRLSNFDDALSKIEEILEPVHSVPLSEIHAKVYTERTLETCYWAIICYLIVL